MNDTNQIRQPNKGLRIALAISVALNLAVLGVVAGAALKHGGAFGGYDGARDVGFGPFTEALGREDRKALRQAILSKAPELRSSRKEMQEDTQSLLAVLRADPFDPAGLAAVMEQQRARMVDRLGLGQAVMRDFLIAMTPDARKAFADRLEERLMHGGGDDKGKP